MSNGICIFYFSATVIYPMLYNFCNFPTGVLPTTYQNAKDVELMADYPVVEPFHKLIKDVSIKCIWYLK